MRLYLHIPFCRSKCGYCDFCSGPDLRLKAAYLSALKSEIVLRTVGHSFSSIYFGGGTPSLLPPQELRELLEGLRAESDAEVTIESNPEDVTPGNLEAWRDLGINRISVGIQSLRESELNALGRRPAMEESFRALGLLSSGWENWSVDLIAGMEGQTQTSLRGTLDGVLRFRPPHLSLYALETKASFRVQPQDADVVAGLLLEAWARLRASGYRHYEISNFCLPGRACRHNLGYWTREEYIGCGVAAHSFQGGVRSWNAADPEAYRERMERGGGAEEGREALTERQAACESILLGLRLDTGIPEAPAFSRKAEELERQEWVVRCRGRLTLTDSGRLMLNDIVLALTTPIS